MNRSSSTGAVVATATALEETNPIPNPNFGCPASFCACGQAFTAKEDLNSKPCTLSKLLEVFAGSKVSCVFCLLLCFRGWLVGFAEDLFCLCFVLHWSERNTCTVCPGARERDDGEAQHGNPRGGGGGALPPPK